MSIKPVVKEFCFISVSFLNKMSSLKSCLALYASLEKLITSLIATISPVRMLWALYTWPKLP